MSTIVFFILIKIYVIGFTDSLVMDNDAVVEQIVNSLSFEVEAVPQDDVLQLTTTTKAAPLNLKIRVRKKDKAAFKNGVISLPNKPNQPDNVPERFRLVSSDHTIMSFSVVMEADFQKSAKKSRGILASCLGSQPDDEDYIYSPSTTYEAKVNDGNSQSDGALTKFTLMKNVDHDEKLATRKKKDFFGRCKPGGCLDPPFGEDRLPYLPATVNKQSTTQTMTKSQRRASSVLSNKIFHKTKKSHDVETLDSKVMPKVPKDASVVDLYQSESQEPYSTNSIMTYPPTFNSSEHHEEKRGSRIRTNLSKNSFNEHSGSYFMIPKKLKYSFDKNDTVKKENDNSILDSKLSETQNNKDRESGALVIKNPVTEKRLSKLTDSIYQKELIPLKSPVSDSSDNIVQIPSPVTAITEQVEMNNRRKESQGTKDSVTRRRNSILNNLLKKHKSSDGKLNSLLQSENIISSNNIPNDQIPTAEQEVFENKPENKSVVTIEGKHQLSDMDLTNPILKKEKKSSSKTKTSTPKPIKEKPSETINHEYDTLQHLWQNQNDSMISDIKFQQEDELVNESDTKNGKLYEIDNKDILKLTSNKSLPNLDNDIKELVREEKNNIKPDETDIDSLSKYYAPTESLKQNDDVIDTITDISDSVNGQETSSIIQLKAAAKENKDILDLIQQEMKFKPATEPSPIIISSNSNTTSEQKNIIDIIELRKTSAIESNDMNQNNLPKLNDETFVFFKGEPSVLESVNSSKTNSENDLLLYANQANIESNKYHNSNIENFQLDDLPEDENMTMQYEKENNAEDPIKDITEDKSVLKKSKQATVERNSYITDDRIKCINDEELSDYLNDPFSNQNENITDLMEYDLFLKGVPSVPDVESNVIDNKLDNKNVTSSKKNIGNDFLLNDLKNNAEFNEHDDRNNKIFQLDGFTGDKTVTSSYLEENSKQDLPTYITEDKPESEKTEQASSNRNSFSCISDDRIEPIKDEKLSDYLNEPLNYKSKTELMNYDEVSSVQGIINFTAESKLDQREGKINNNQDLENEIIESQIESVKSHEPINDPEQLNITEKMQDRTSKDSAFHESTNKTQSLSLVDNSEILQFTDQNKINNDKQLKFDHEMKTDNKTITSLKQAGFENGLSDKYILSKPFETTTANKARPIFVNFAIQIYVDDKNHTIVKSLDADNVPKLYPKDFIKVTKQYLNIDEEIQIPVDLDNILYIQMKSNKLRDTIDVASNNIHNKDEGVTENLTFSKPKLYPNELDPIKRNGIIVEDIQKTLEVVYEKELLPLRSNISELNENIKLLTAHHMLLKSKKNGHMFVTKKSRSTKIIPIFKKCSCTRR